MSFKVGAHAVKNRKLELILGFLFFALGSYLLWDAYDNRGKKMKWPFGAVMPF